MKNNTETSELCRDDQVTLLTFFGNGRNTLDFNTVSKVSERQMKSLNSLVKQGFITTEKLGPKGVSYTPVKKKCGTPTFELEPAKKTECFDIFK